MRGAKHLYDFSPTQSRARKLLDDAFPRGVRRLWPQGYFLCRGSGAGCDESILQAIRLPLQF